MKNNVPPVLVTFAFLFFVLLPKAHAVSPAPDGGYPGGNTAEGTNALFSVTTGIQNTALGQQALFHLTYGNENTAVGFQTLFNNTTGTENTACGSQALAANTI